MFRFERKEITGEWIQPPNQEVHNLFLHRVVSRSMKLEGYWEFLLLFSSVYVLFSEYCFIIGSPKLVKLLQCLKYLAMKVYKGSARDVPGGLNVSISCVHATRTDLSSLQGKNIRFTSMWSNLKLRASLAFGQQKFPPMSDIEPSNCGSYPSL
jgi:hypothetical protein